MSEVKQRLLTKEEILSKAIPFTRLMHVEKANVIYFLIHNKEIIYIGQSVFPAGRFSNHKTYKCKFDSYSFVYVDDLEERLDLESDYIDKYKPCYNGKNNYRVMKASQEKKDLIKQLNEKFDSFILIAKDEKYNKVYFNTKPHWSDTVSLFDSAFKKYPKIKRLLKINFFKI